MNRVSLLLLAWLGLIVLAWGGCLPTDQVDEQTETLGLAPLYATDGATDIASGPPRAITSLGKIYYKDGLIFATERGQGIHIIDNTDPAKPEKIKFIQIAGNSDVSIRGNTLYANNGNDLVAIDIGDLDSVRVVSRVQNAFSRFSADFPEGYRGYFECVDPARGPVMGWYETTLTNPECWR